MPYKYLEKVATADIAFDAWGSTLEELFIASSDAIVNTMVENPDAIRKEELKNIRAENNAIDILLFDVLQEIIFFKDAFRLLLRFDKVKILNNNDQFFFEGNAWGEKIDIRRHRLALDVKAVTLYQFGVYKIDEGWKSHVILDI